ncbi:MAG: orotidine-5'-phosphate decarboxylase [Vampirovibrionales bacterium]
MQTSSTSLMTPVAIPPLGTRKASDVLIVALDVEGYQPAMALSQQVQQVGVTWVKVGMSLYYQTGPALITALREQGLNVFVDLKLHDIPETIARTTRVLVEAGASFLNVHASGGIPMMHAAYEAAHQAAEATQQAMPTLIGVTVLTSTSQKLLAETLGVIRPIPELVVHLAKQTQQAGLHGVVCSAQEAPFLRAEASMAEPFLLVTPGIRPATHLEGSDDQHRILTPQKAIEAGSSMLVVGRPIYQAPSPEHVAREMLHEIQGALDAQRGST